MAGMFRNHSISTTGYNTYEATPNKRFSFGAFCTSPSTLQDVTMDNSYGIGSRSPCATLQTYQGSTSPATQGRSVREFEEQMATLRKENFNLKLRLYFIEESIPGYQQGNSPDSQESLMNQLIDTKVEIEMLRKDVQEKQDLLKEAAQAMNQMELIQKETEAKSQTIVDELNQKIQLLHMEKQMDKTPNAELMNELLGRSSISENINAIQRVHELEGLLEESNQKLINLQGQICKLDEILHKRDETIKEYEDKVKELAFQNSEMQEALENREKEVAFAESIISIKTANTARLLDRIQEYEKMVTKINFERHVAKRENRFFRAIIGKLQRSNNNECYSIEKEEIYQQIGSNFKEKFLDITPCNSFEFDKNFREVKACGDFHGEYKLQQKLRVNICNSGRFPKRSTTSLDGCENHYDNANCSRMRCEIEPEIPIRYTFSDSSLFSEGGGIDSVCDACKVNSSSSLHPNFSSSSIMPGREIADEIYIKFQNVREELYEVKSMLADKTCLLQETEEKLEHLTQLHQKACRTLKSFYANITSQQDERNKLKKKDKENISQSPNVSGKEQTNVLVSQSGLSALEYTAGLSRSMSDTEGFTNELTLMEKEEYDAKIAEQRVIISSLKAEVKKKTANLQNLVNKELWEKNREIERLTKLINNTKECPSSVLSPNKENLPTNELQQSFTEADYLKAVERNKLLQKKIDLLIQRLSANRNNEAVIAQLRNDVREARSEAGQAEKWRLECADVCAVLSNRLEELANFLNSLLKHKDVLGLLAADRRRAMRKAVDRSLDLSKSLNMTLSMTGISMTDQSLLQISNFSEILGDLADRQDRTFNSHEELLRAEARTETKEAVKTEHETPKQELDQHPHRKERHSLPLICIDNQSESEAWSEPDRNVSMARIGLEDHAVATLRNQPNTIPPKVQMETDSESDVINRSRSTKLAPSTPSRGLERISQLEQIIVKRDDRILDIQCQLVDVDSSLKKENLKVVELTNELDQLRRQNEELEKKVSAAIDSECDRNLYERNEILLRRQIEEKAISLEKIEEERDRLSVEARVAEIQIGALRTELDVAKRRHDEEITQVREEERQKLEQVQAEHRSILQARLEEQQQKHEDTLARNWIARTLYEESQQQMERLQTQLKEAQDQIEYLRENEEEMKKALIDSELAMRSCKKELDESAMQASKAVLERTRALNENLQLEKRVDDLNLQIQCIESQVGAMQQKIDQLEDTRLTLQQELDVANVQLQTLRGSEISPSGYTSEDVAIHNDSSSTTERSPNQQRQNSSPDLGIESDAARNMSIELSSAEHHKLKAIELQNNKAEETMDADFITTKNMERVNSQPPNLTNNHIGSHDCQKVDQENIELRRKLIRTKRALEDTYEKLRISNQRKAQIEKDIKNQILKTHNVLRNVRTNMENEL